MIMLSHEIALRQFVASNLHRFFHCQYCGPYITWASIFCCRSLMHTNDSIPHFFHSRFIFSSDVCGKPNFSFASYDYVCSTYILVYLRMRLPAFRLFTIILTDRSSAWPSHNRDNRLLILTRQKKLNFVNDSGCKLSERLNLVFGCVEQV